MRPPRIEVQTSPGCPNADDALNLVMQTVNVMAPGTPVLHVRVVDDEQAQALNFLGSPTVLVDGRDLAGAKQAIAGLT